MGLVLEEFCGMCAVFYRSSYAREEDLLYDSDTPEALGAAFASSPSSSIRVRKDFTETWFYEMAEAG